jgi:septum formation protein
MTSPTLPVDPPFLYLASQSPRRGQLLEQLGLSYRLLLPDASEDAESLEATQAGEHARDYVTRVVRAKAAAAAARRVDRHLPAAAILCADTTVSLDGTVLGKPVDADDAARILNLLSGRRHAVLTAIAVVPVSPTTGTPVHCALSTSTVTFRTLDDNDIARYIASGEPFGKAGAYGIQGRAAAFIAHLEGSYSGVMGLPLFETASLLRDAAPMAYDVALSHRDTSQ